MSDCMAFPDTVEAFMEQYKIIDTEQIYTNGAELVPIFRMKQWFEHLPSAQPERKKRKWIDCNNSDHWKCSECGDRAPMYWNANRQEYDEWFSPFCPNCGADMRGEQDE